MKRMIILATVSVAFLSASCQVGGGKATLNNEADSVSYALGTLIGNSMRQQAAQMPFDTINFELYAQSIEHSGLSERYVEYIQPMLDTIMQPLFMKACVAQLAHGENMMPLDTAEKICNGKSDRKRAAKEAERKKLGEQNLAEGKAFLDGNAQKEGVVCLESGLQYKILKAGTGAKPGPTSSVKVNYRGTLLDGTLFDESKSGPTTLNVGGVIKGWQEALQLMPVGSKWQLFIPGDLAYGERGGGEKIGPNATLLFDVELVEIVK